MIQRVQGEDLLTSNRDGIYRNWFGDDVDHQPNLDLLDASCVYRHDRDRLRRVLCVYGCLRIG